MVHQRIAGVVFAGLLFFTGHWLFADETYPFTPDSSWSAPLYYYIEDSIQLCTRLSADGGDAGGEQTPLYSRLGTALRRWQDVNSASALYLHSLLDNETADSGTWNAAGTGAETEQALGDGSPEAPTSRMLDEVRGVKRNLISLANDALKIVAELDDLGADFSSGSGDRKRLLENLLRVMPLLRPDITPTYSFWSTLPESVDGMDASTVISAMGSGSSTQLEQLLEDARASSAHRRVLDRRLSAGSGFQPLVDDPVRILYSAGLEESAPLILEDAEYVYYRDVHRDFFHARLRSGTTWSSYIDNLRRTQRNLDGVLGPEIPPRQLLARLKIDSETRSDAYWSLLSLLENPIYVDDPDRSAHIEAVQLHFLRNYVLADQAVDTNDVELYLPPAPGGSGEAAPALDGIQEQGRARRYMVLIHKESRGKEFIRSWAEATLQVERLNPDDIWHIQTGFFPLKAQNFTSGKDSELRSAEIILRILESFPDSGDLERVTDPAAVQLAQFRRIMLYADLYHSMKGHPVMEQLSLKEQNWLHLASDLYSGIRAGGEADISAALSDLSDFLEVEFTPYSFSSLLLSRIFGSDQSEE